MGKLAIPISVLELISVLEGQTVAQAFGRAKDLAQHVDELGFKRLWLAEHHNSRAIVSSATAVAIGFIASVTKQIRVGSGGVMLPNHAPLIVAEQFGTLNAIYQNRIDLGLGRAPGTDPFTARALRRANHVEDFEQNVLELYYYLAGADEAHTIKAYPGFGEQIPMWILGSSLYSAELAARRGMPYVFAAHFAPDYFAEAVKLYKAQFKPSKGLDKPYVMACVNAIVAETAEEAAHLATTFYQFSLSIIRRNHQLLQPPVSDMDKIWSPYEKEALQQQRAYTFIGSKEQVAEQMTTFVEEHGIDELMVTTAIFDNKARKHSYTLLREIFE